MTDYNFETPSTSLLAGEPTVVSVAQNSTYEIYDYPGIYLNQSQASEMTKIYMQEEEAGRKVITGTGGCRGFMSGYTFDLEEHYRDDLNTNYLLTEVRHVASVGKATPLATKAPAPTTPIISCAFPRRLRFALRELPPNPWSRVRKPPWW